MNQTGRPTNEAIRIGISSCLLGEEVRFDGGHKQDRYLTRTLGAYFDWVPVCPEVEIGMGIPRETIRLVQINDATRLRTTKSNIDFTDRMRRFARERIDTLLEMNLSGYILKKDSPSCGMERVKLYTEKGPAKRIGIGVFAAALLERFPNLPTEEEGRLCDPRLRENWVERVFAYHALQQLWGKPWRVGDLVDFHTRYKFVLLAHDEAKYRELGRLVANAKALPRSELRESYESSFMSGLKRIATTRKNVNVLQHMLGFFSKELDTNSRQELVTHIEDYHRGLVPLVVPMTLIRHYVRLLGVVYLADQVYLNPHPKELALRNHV
ncbi:MAG: DUF1722 domain-containing protein [Planctomycetales bacterium]|nr:DUF1722 domain-containing protein [Planctomycetales bacterium]